MEFAKLCAPTLKQLFIEQLEHMILSGELVIGQRLPAERELAASMQISRSVVNAGIVEMADKGFLEIVPRSGTYVADYRKKGKLETLVSIMKFNGGTLPDADIRSILEIRKVLSALALECLIPKIHEEELAELFKCSAALDKAESAEEAAEIVFNFDLLLCNYSGNTLLPMIFHSFQAPNMTLFSRFFRLHGYASLRARTRAVCEAIRDRDINRAVAIISRSIDQTIGGSTPLYN
ncbi:MAG: GntR family transcriptional regulator [Oscillospiraceae bacterium]